MITRFDEFGIIFDPSAMSSDCFQQVLWYKTSISMRTSLFGSNLLFASFFWSLRTGRFLGTRSGEINGCGSNSNCNSYILGYIFIDLDTEHCLGERTLFFSTYGILFLQFSPSKVPVGPRNGRYLLSGIFKFKSIVLYWCKKIILYRRSSQHQRCIIVFGTTVSNHGTHFENTFLIDKCSSKIQPTWASSKWYFLLISLRSQLSTGTSL